MASYTLRQGFTILRGTDIFSGGDTVELSEFEFALHKHKLEGIGSTIKEIDSPGGGVAAGGSGLLGYPAPFVREIVPSRLLTNNIQTFTLFGSFFTPETTVNVTSGTITRVQFISSHELLVTITTAATPGDYDLVVDNGSQTISSGLLTTFDIPDGLVDLRLGGTEFSQGAIEMRDGMSFTRAADGLYFTGSDPWASWARFVGDNDAWVWNRRIKKRLTWIYQSTSSFMLGIGSRANDSYSNSQFYQGEILCYNSSGTDINNIYGNNGNLGRGKTQAFSVSKSPEDVIKVVFNQNGESGAVMSVFKLPGTFISDWLDSSELLGEIQLTAFGNELNIMPFAIPQDGTSSKFLGFILEDE